MKTLQEKYNAIQQGNFSKEQFLVEARMQQPQLVTRFNGYNDAVQILKNRGMIKEAASFKFSDLKQGSIIQNKFSGEKYTVTAVRDKSADIQKGDDGKETEIASLNNYELIKEARLTKESFKDYSNDALTDMIANLSRYENSEGEIELVKQELARRKGVVKEAGGHASINNLSKFHGITGDKLPEDREGLEKALKAAEEGGNKRTAQEIRIALKKLNEARLTKNNLTDYRYKPTNEMDKYPYEQILRGLRVELEAMGVQGTPTAEEYAKALAKVSKNLAKDSIFYTNQLAGVNPKVDLHDKMIDVTAKNTVDTFNGMKKVKDLKEDHTKDPDDKYTVKFSKANDTYQVWEGDHLVTDFATKEKAKAYADKKNTQQGLTESVLKEGIKNLIKKALMENEEDIYEMQGPKTDAEYKRELENYLEDNQIYGYTDMLFDILTAPDEEQVADSLADFLDDHQIYGYNKGLLAIFRDYANRDQSEDEWDEADYERMSNSIEDSVDESAMGDLYQIAKEHDRFEHFVQAVEDEFGPVDNIAELEHIFNSTRGEDDIDYDDENFSDPFIDGEDLFESVSLKDLL